MKSSQSNFDLRSPSSYLARSYQIATVISLKRERNNPWCNILLHTQLYNLVYSIKVSRIKRVICHIGITGKDQFLKVEPFEVSFQTSDLIGISRHLTLQQVIHIAKNNLKEKLSEKCFALQTQLNLGNWNQHSMPIFNGNY